MGVPPYGPYLKSPSVYEKNNKLREILLTKRKQQQLHFGIALSHNISLVINAERAALSAPAFKGRLMRTRRNLLDNYANEIFADAKTKKSFLLGNLTKTKDQLLDRLSTVGETMIKSEEGQKKYESGSNENQVSSNQ